MYLLITLRDLLNVDFFKNFKKDYICDLHQNLEVTKSSNWGNYIRIMNGYFELVKQSLCIHNNNEVHILHDRMWSGHFDMDTYLCLILSVATVHHFCCCLQNFWPTNALGALIKDINTMLWIFPETLSFIIHLARYSLPTNNSVYFKIDF